MIIAAAVRHAGRVYALPAPARHGDVLVYMYDQGCPTPPYGDATEGFIDSEQGFVSRRDAYVIVMEERQPLRDGKKEPDLRELFSEDLW